MMAPREPSNARRLLWFYSGRRLLEHNIHFAEKPATTVMILVILWLSAVMQPPVVNLLDSPVKLRSLFNEVSEFFEA